MEDLSLYVMSFYGRGRSDYWLACKVNLQLYDYPNSCFIYKSHHFYVILVTDVFFFVFFGH